MKGSIDESKGLTKVETQELEPKQTAKPVLRKRPQLTRTEQIDLEVNEDSRKNASEILRGHFEQVAEGYDSQAELTARDLVDEVMPEFIQWNERKQAERVAAHVRQYLEEGAESLTPKFRSNSEASRQGCIRGASEILREFTGE